MALAPLILRFQKQDGSPLRRPIDHQLADHLDNAADLIDRHGYRVGGAWEGHGRISLIDAVWNARTPGVGAARTIASINAFEDEVGTGIIRYGLDSNKQKATAALRRTARKLRGLSR